jgi:hypothetical protein
MQSSQLMMTVVLFGGFIAFAIFMTVKRRKAMANLGPAFRRFFEQTGYRIAELGNAPLDEHARIAAENSKAMSKGTFAQHLVKDFHGIPLHHESTMSTEWRAGTTVTSMSCRWAIPTGQPPRVLWQIADRSLSGFGKALKEAFSNTSRNWKPTYPQRVETGDPELDKRFVVFCVDPSTTLHALAAPGLKQQLLACTEVDLCVEAQQVTFSDPFQKNIRAGMPITMDYARFMDATIPIHERIAQLLVATARASY